MDSNGSPALVGSSESLSVSPLLQRMPHGQVMATGVIDGHRVELVRYTEEDIKNRDAQWKYELERERSIAREARCRMANIELDLRRVLDGEPTLCDFAIVEEIRQRLTDND
jgi:hypothetical protein